MRQRNFLAVSLLSLFLTAVPASAAMLELALVIDGSSSISGPAGNSPGPDWDLQIGAYQSIFEDSFYSNVVQQGTFDEVAVAAFVFSAVDGVVEITDPDDNVVETVPYDIVVTSFLDWTLIDSDQAAADFGALFATLPQPGGRTNTSEALEIAAQGGTVGCPVSTLLGPILPFCNLDETTAPGLLNNGFSGDALVIDISTDGVPTEPNGDGVPNDPDRDLAQAAADGARAAGIRVNAIGVGNLDPTFLEELVSGNPDGFFVTAEDFSEFQGALDSKLNVELGVIPLPGALPLFLSALAGLAVWRRRRA